MVRQDRRESGFEVGLGRGERDLNQPLDVGGAEGGGAAEVLGEGEH